MSASQYRCPKCEGNNFKRLQLPHPLILHWILNPGLLINEVVLGQRLPKVQLICKDCEGTALDRSYVPCPSCNTMHWGRLWSRKRAFGNWRGVACPACGRAIPCLWNVFSLIVLFVTFPLWSLPYFFHFRKQPLKRIYKLEEDGSLPKPIPITKKTWIYMGAGWGVFMWIFTSLIPALTSVAQGEFAWNLILTGLPVWTIGGFAFGFFMWFFLGRKRLLTNQGEQ